LKEKALYQTYILGKGFLFLSFYKNNITAKLFQKIAA